MKFKWFSSCAAAFLSIAPTLYAQTDPIVFVDQGAEWTTSIRADFYTQDQGSRILPLAWMQALSRDDGTGFLSDALSRYGYLNNPDTPGIPVGFSIANWEGQANIGMTCAACHTRQIEVEDTKYQIDGGPAVVDFQSFLADLDRAMQGVIDSDAAFDAFAARVLGANPTDSQIAELRSDITLWQLRFHTLIDRALPDPAWGPSRLDAVSMIFNRLAGLDLGPAPDYLIPENIALADAPTRYPFLWNAARQDYTQWPGFAKNGNALFGLARNLGEVYGVFGVFHPKPSNSIFRSHDYLDGNSANFSGLGALEDMIWKIGPPVWPWALDTGKAAQGRAIFNRSTDAGGCVDCHGIARGEIRFGPKSTWKTPIQDVGTDTRECSILARKVKTGILEGARIPVIGERLKEEDLAFNLLSTSVVNTILQQGLSPRTETTLLGLSEGERESFPSEFQDVEDAFSTDLMQQSQTLLAGSGCKYEARVLEGIWAAAPYLHNGSVRSLEDLLKPATERTASFAIGPAYDIGAVGLSETQDRFDYILETTSCDDISSGNSRCGHEFGTELDDTEKAVLLEYLKSL